MRVLKKPITWSIISIGLALLVSVWIIRCGTEETDTSATDTTLVQDIETSSPIAEYRESDEQAKARNIVAIA